LRIRGIYEEVRFPRAASTNNKESIRPYVVLNTVQSMDGKAAIGGKASGLGTDTDRGAMRTLRSRADAVMVGGGTVRAERLSLSLDAEDTRAVPRAVILTNSGDLRLEKNLVRDRRQDVLVLLPEGAENGAEERLARLAETRRVSATESGTIDAGRALEILKADYGVNVLLCEGGPTLNRALIDAGLVDELFLTIAPVLVGAQDTEGLGSPPQQPPRSLRLISSQVAGDEMFLRYAVERRS
jgi:riboflavin-specific deaminase-like protein